MNRIVITSAAFAASIVVATGATAEEGAQFAATASETADGAKIVLRRTSDPDLPAATARVGGGVLVVGFANPVAGDVGPIASGAPRTVAAARRDPDGKTLRISLRRALAAELRQTQNETIIELRPTSQVVSEPVAPAASAAQTSPNATLSIGANAERTRLSFQFRREGVTVTPVKRGQRVELRFSQAADIDLSDLTVTPPRHVRRAERLVGAGGKLVVALDLDPGVEVRQFVEGARVIVDVAPTGAVAASEAAAAAAAQPSGPDPAGRSGVAAVRIEEKPDETKITVTWARPARAAAFRRGDSVWLAFDSSARLNVQGAGRTLVEQVRGEGVVALRLTPGIRGNLSATARGPVWEFTIGPRMADPNRAAAVRRDVGVGGRGRVVVAFDREGVVRKLVDPAVGDTLDVALLEGEPRGVASRRGALESAVLASAHGGAIERRADGVVSRFENGALVVTREAGVGTAAVQLEPVEPIVAEGILDLRPLALTPADKVLDRLNELQRLAAAEGADEGARVEARMAVARFLLAHELAAEALGALKIAAINQPQLAANAEFRLLRGAANTMMGRLREAHQDLDASILADEPNAALWRGYLAVEEGAWAQGRREIERGRRALATQPPAWAAKFQLALGRASLALQDIDAAAAAAQAAMGAGASPETTGEARILQAKAAEARGDAQAALAVFQELSKSPQESVAVRAAYEIARVQRALGAAQAASIADLEALRMRWRGDDLELEIVRQLGGLYAEMGRWRDALLTLTSAANRHSTKPMARTMRMDMADLFERLFLDGEADKLEPIQALGLFYDYKDLTPVGPNGDRMVRNLAGRLVALDLMEQAAALLQHQVDQRLEGVGRAQIAGDLAMVYLDDRKPAKALAVIEATRQPNLPREIVDERRILEAKALLDLDRADHALEVLERDRSVAAQRVRAQAAWKMRDWPRAAAELGQLLAMRPKSEAISAPDREVVMRAAIALVFADDRRGLEALRRDYGAAMRDSPEADAFEVVTSNVEPRGEKFREIATSVARTDLLDRFLAGMKARMAPAPPAGPAPARTAAQPQPPRA